MHTIYLALGANIGRKKTNIKRAIDRLQEHISHVVVGPIYETKPWGFTEQKNFLNTALLGETELTPEELLSFVKKVEEKIGRMKRFTNGPREIDIDIIFYDDSQYSSSKIITPHPRMHERDFVLTPLADIAAGKKHPVLQKTVSQLLKELPKENRFVVKKVED